MGINIYSAKSDCEFAENVGKYILSIQETVLELSERFKIGVSGGSMSNILKQALIDNEKIKERIKWSEWEVFFCDERLVPLSHNESNYNSFHESILKNLNEKQGYPIVHAINEKLLTGKDGKELEMDILKDKEIAEQYQNCLPKDFKIDLILLGCGPDGHTCSIFPGHSVLKEESKYISNIYDSPKNPPRRITFTLRLLKNAYSIAFIAKGPDKKEILKKIFIEKDESLPAYTVSGLNVPNSVNWFVDFSAIENMKLK